MVADTILDLALAPFDTNATGLYLCSQEPTTYTEATATYRIGYKTGISIGSPSARTGGGRRVTVAAITDGTVYTGGGTVTHYAIVNSNSSLLMATGSLSTSKLLVDTDPFTLDAFDINIID